MTHLSVTFRTEGKPTNYYNQTRRGLMYVIPSTQFDSESEKSLSSHSLDSSNWESDISVKVVFKKLFANMTSTSQVK